MSPAADDSPFVPYVAHADFRAGLPHGRYRVVVDPARARPYILHRTKATLVAIALIGCGAAAALAGQGWVGGSLVAVGIVASRVVRHQAARIVLHLALHDASVYEEVTTSGVMEVRAHEADG